MPIGSATTGTWLICFDSTCTVPPTTCWCDCGVPWPIHRQQKKYPEIPTEALAGHQPRRHFNQRRQQDPLGEGHPATWQTRLIKVAAEIIPSSRRILVRLSGCWPYLNHYREAPEAVLNISRKVPWRPG